MDDFGWSMQYAAEPCLPSRPSDDGLLSEFLGGGFDLRSDHGGLDLPSSYPVQNLVQCHDAAGLSAGVPAGFMGLDTADVLPSVVAGAVEEGLLDPFVYAPNVVGAVAEEPAQAAASNTAFSGYSSTTGGNGNISSGESNSCGGGYDTEVASPPCAVSRPGLLQTTTGGVPPSTRKPGKYATARAASGTQAAAAAAAAGRRGEKQAAATSSSSSSIAFNRSADGGGYEPDSEAIAQVKEMIYRAAAMRPVHQLVCGAGEPPASQNQTRPRRKNVRISSDPQTVAARLRRERVSERLRVLQRLVPGGSRMDTASMLDEAASYLKFLKSQLKALERASPSNGGYHSSSLLQSYAGSSLGVGGGSGGASTVLTVGRDSAIGGYVKSNRDMQL